jgi:hypothetical protein
MTHVADAESGFPDPGGSQNSDSATRGLGESGHDPQQRGLTRSIVSQQSVKTPGRKSPGYAAQGGEAAEQLGYILKLNGEGASNWDRAGGGGCAGRNVYRRSLF